MMYLPADLRTQLEGQGIRVPPDGTDELEKWIVRQREENPEVYRLILLHASASAPPVESEQIQQRQKRVGIFSRTARKTFTKRSLTGEKIANRKLIAAVGLGLPVIFVLVLMFLSMTTPRKTANVTGQTTPAPREEVSAPPQKPPPAQISPGTAQTETAVTPPPAPGPSSPQSPPPTPRVEFPPVPSATSAPPPQDVVFARQEPQQAKTQGEIVYDASPPAQVQAGNILVYEARNPVEKTQTGQSLFVYDAGAQSRQDQAAQAEGARPSSAKETGSTPVPALMPGQRIDGILATGVVAVEGAQGIPVIVTSADGATWMGAATLGPAGRVQIMLEQMVTGNAVIPVKATVLDRSTQAAGLSGRAKSVNPQVAQALAVGVAQGVAEYMKALANQQTVTTTNGWITITSGSAGPWWAYLLGGLSGQIPQLVAPGGKPVTVVEVPRDTPVTILVLSAGGR